MSHKQTLQQRRRLEIVELKQRLQASGRRVIEALKAEAEAQQKAALAQAILSRVGVGAARKIRRLAWLFAGVWILAWDGLWVWIGLHGW